MYRVGSNNGYGIYDDDKGVIVMVYAYLLTNELNIYSRLT
jgi:hypothetical protein